LNKVPRRINKVGDYTCIFEIACAWRDTIGAIPTLSRNKQAVSGPKKTNFQSYIDEAACNLIGPGIVRAVVDALRAPKTIHN
jgi:hypothetical protein